MNKSQFFLSTFAVILLSGCIHKPLNSETNTNELPPGTPLVLDTEIPASNNTQSPSSFSTIPAIQYRKVQDDIYTSHYQEYPEVVRYDRYTLVGSSPVGGQKYLLEQLVSVNMISKKKTAYTLSVEQGLSNTLKDTGFTLCSVTSPEVRSLFNHRLPKVHYQFGPMKLREALQMLSGEAYELTVNDTLRQICFERRHSIPKPSTPLPQVEASIDRTQ